MYRSHTLLWAWLHGLASRAGFQTFSTENTAENPRGFCSYNKIPPLLYLYPAFEPDSSRGCVQKSDLKSLIFNGNLYTKRYRVCSKNQLLKHHVIVSCLLWVGPYVSELKWRLVKKLTAASCSSATLAGATEQVRIRFALPIYNNTSNKKHFMKNVKECRDVVVKKVLEQGWDTRTTHYTHVGPMTPYIVV